jgi:F0F1-type ATP synthase assembly protein I
MRTKKVMTQGLGLALGVLISNTIVFSAISGNTAIGITGGLIAAFLVLVIYAGIAIFKKDHLSEKENSQEL